MKVLLTQDIPKMGKRGEIIDVKKGYGRNYIIANGMGVIATKEAMNVANRSIAAQEYKEKIEKDQAVELSNELNGKKVTISAKTGESDRLFGAVTSKEISEAIREQLKVEIDKKYVELQDGAIKTLGEHEIVLRVYADTTTKIIVAVIAEQ